MRPPLTERQAELLLFVKRYSTSHGYSPSVREIQESMKIKNPNGVQAHLHALMKKGYLRQRDRQTARSLVIIGEKSEMDQARFLITALLPANVEKYPAVAELALKWLKRNDDGSKVEDFGCTKVGTHTQADQKATAVAVGKVLDTV